MKMPVAIRKMAPQLWNLYWPIAIVDLEYNETRFENDDMRDHRIVLGVRVLGDVEILLNLVSDRKSVV